MSLDRFAQLFIAPLFNENSTEREREAVHSEHLKNKRNDARRFAMVRQTLANPLHPYHKFGTGNRYTLRGHAEGDLREAVIQFYNNYYASNSMKLVVYSKSSLDDMAAMVVSKFSALKKSSTPLVYPYVGVPVYLPGGQHEQKKIWVQTTAPSMSLQLRWTLPDHLQFLRQKPLEYLCYLLDDRSAGGLYALLRTHHLATSTDASYAMIQGATFFTIAIELTTAGLLDHETVVSHVFQYLGLLQSTNPSQTIFDDVLALLQLKGLYPQTSSVMLLCSQLAGNMHIYGPVNAVCGPYSIETFDPDLITATLNALRSDNFQLYLLQNEPSINAHYHITFPLTTAWYETKYEMEELSSDFLTVRWPRSLYFPSPPSLLTTRRSILLSDLPQGRPSMHHGPCLPETNLSDPLSPFMLDRTPKSLL